MILLLIKYKSVYFFYLLHEEPCKVDVANKPLLLLLLLLFIILHLAFQLLKKGKYPWKANFLDENLYINMEELNEPMEVIYEPMKTIPGDHTYYLSNNSTPCYACQDKYNFISKTIKLTLENIQLKHRSILKTSTITSRKIKTAVKM